VNDASDDGKVMEVDYYSILGIPPQTADKEIIKRAYRALAVKWHPDQQQMNDNNKEEIESIFTQISEAYQVLIDDVKRKMYDASRHMMPHHPTSFPPHFNKDDGTRGIHPFSKEVLEEARTTTTASKFNVEADARKVLVDDAKRKMYDASHHMMPHYPTSFPPHFNKDDGTRGIHPFSKEFIEGARTTTTSSKFNVEADARKVFRDFFAQEKKRPDTAPHFTPAEQPPAPNSPPWQVCRTNLHNCISTAAGNRSLMMECHEKFQQCLMKGN
jgi:DnaJ-class molecular chaperone